MELKEIYELQRKIDEAFAARKDVDNTTRTRSLKEFHRMKTIALMVEAAEYANEIQTFKYWKANKNIQNDKILEEFADIMHFACSLAIEYKVPSNVEPIIASQDQNIQLAKLFSAISKCMKTLNTKNVQNALALALGSAKLNGYSDEEIYKWYKYKNDKNYQRIKDKY